MDERIAANQRSWDERVAIHAASAFYGVDAWLDEQPGPRAEELAVLGAVEGATLVHLQCHFGMDTMQFARAGAAVTGIDFSSAAIAEARSLATRAGLEDRARFVCSEMSAAAGVLGGERFDIVYVSLGSLCWLPDIVEWGAVVAALLAPGGRLFVFDVHPLSQMLGDEDGSTVTYSYFQEPQGYADDFEYTYTDGVALVHRETYWWNHSVAETLGALTAAGLAIELFEEHDWTRFEQFAWLEHDGRDRWVIPAGRPRIPLTMTVVARAAS